MSRNRHLSGLNREQSLAVRTTAGPLLVLAGAGTGKTRVVTCRIAELIAIGVRPEAILALTFTNKAAREMRERVHTVLEGTDVSGMVVSTFHALGLRLLREFGHRLGYSRETTIADSADQSELIADLLREAGIRRDRMHPRAAHFKISMWKNAALTPDQAEDRAEDDLDISLAHVYQRYEEELFRRRLLDFDDLILKVLLLVEKDAEVLRTLRDRWQYLLVDEYQDTNGTQYRLLRHLAMPRANLCVVGDDDQSIYGWRGADSERILGFAKDFPGAKTVALEQNYRSTTAILDLANLLIAQNQHRHDKKLWSETKDGPPVELYVAEDEKDELDWIASCLLRYKQRSGLKWEDLCVLFRANRQCRPLEQALRGRQIPYRVVGTSSFFDRREVRDLLSYAKLAANPKDDGSFMRIANVPARGLGRGTLEKLMAFAATKRAPLVEMLDEHQADIPAAAREGGRALLDLLKGLRETTARSGIGAAFAELVEKSGYAHHVRQTIEDPLELTARLKVVDEVVDMAKAASGTDLVKWLTELSLESEPDRGKKEQEKPGVTLLTMHAAKGLEYPVVFIVGVEEGTLPHTRSLDDEDDAAATPGKGIEEERRLFYVGLTRARRHLHVSYARERQRFGKAETRVPSRFIEDIGMERFKMVTADSEPPVTEQDGKEWLARIRASFKSGAESAPN